MKIIDKWKDELDCGFDCKYNYVTIALNETDRCDIHLADETGFIYIVDAPGGEVYHYNNIMCGYRDLTSEEKDEVLSIGIEEFQ